MAKKPTKTGSPRLLSVVWYKVLPPVFGGQKGVAFFNEHLGRLAPLVCLCSKDNEAIPASYRIDASLPVGKAQFFNPFCWRKIFAAAKKTKATHVVLEFPYHGLAGVLCQRLLSVQLLVHAHNLEGIRFRKQKKTGWRLLQAYEKWTLKKADVIFFKTEKERDYAVKHWAIDKSKTTLVPYGVTVQQQPDKGMAREILCQRHGLLPGTKLLLFAGTLDYGPNAAAVTALKEKLVPLLSQIPAPCKILVCGRIENEAFAYLRQATDAHLLYAGNVADIESYFAAADVFLNPVTTGGGVQTKIADALCFHLNVVCFAGMDEGITGAGNKIFSVPMNDWPAFARAVGHALVKTERTPPAFFEWHNWPNIAAKTYRFIEKA